jgi:hypothetical protein
MRPIILMENLTIMPLLVRKLENLRRKRKRRKVETLMEATQIQVHPQKLRKRRRKRIIRRSHRPHKIMAAAL